MTIDDSERNRARPVIRARVDRATACFYPGSQRLVLVADRLDVEAAETALTELKAYLVKTGALPEPIKECLVLPMPEEAL